MTGSMISLLFWKAVQLPTKKANTGSLVFGSWMEKQREKFKRQKCLDRISKGDATSALTKVQVNEIKFSEQQQQQFKHIMLLTYFITKGTAHLLYHQIGFKEAISSCLISSQMGFWLLNADNNCKIQLSGSGCGSVGRAVAFNTRGPRFNSSHRQNFIEHLFIINCIEKTKINKKRPGMDHFLKKKHIVVYLRKRLFQVLGG